ncbi:DUF7167 family protein [Paenibacillus camelliae]|uniref:DUF7167 family protein n=1 Tax=Paenibacillus camelliae TaxID=512410 RepID=UPI0020410D4C|nr:hypothetical protein [Paenibacillus camelliae]MCM3632885.1 hypothetical protein [Paenibacillus camelliae]
MSKQVTFFVSTGYVGSKREETLTFDELGIDENLEGEELEKELQEAFNEWVWENINAYYEVGESSE